MLYNFKTYIMENEIWKDINGYEGLYQISNFGRVKSLKRKWCKNDRIIKGGKGGCGNHKYIFVVLRKNKKAKSKSVSRLVGSHFIRLPKNGEEINHIDFNTFNNNVNNLEWVTSKQNSLHSRVNMSLSKQGEKHPKSKVSDKDAIEIKKMRKEKIKCKKIAKIYGITVNDVLNISTRYYKHLNHLI